MEVGRRFPARGWHLEDPKHGNPALLCGEEWRKWAGGGRRGVGWLKGLPRLLAGGDGHGGGGRRQARFAWCL